MDHFEELESGNSLEYVEATLKKKKYVEEAEKFYEGDEQVDPVELLKRYSEEIEASFPAQIDEEEIRQQNETGYARFEEALNFIATGKLVEA